MSSQSSGRRRSNNRQQYSAEDQALNMISKEAEARLAAKRAARAEAREIRMKEIEKQQKESEAKQDRVTNEHGSSKLRQQLPGSRSGSRQGSRRGSIESNDSDTKDMDLKGELRELEDKYKAAMMTSAQLDNEKQSLVYQVELLKDQLEEQDEGYTELQREYKEKCREYDFQKRDLQSMEHELSILKQQLEIKDRLIEESGFVIVANDKGEPVLEKTASGPSNGPLPSGAVLVSVETRDFLDKAGGGTLGTALSDDVNKSGVVDSETCQKASHSVSSSSVDVHDGGGGVHNKREGQESKGEDEVDSASLKVEDNECLDSNRAKVETLHDSHDVTTNETVQCEHDLLVESCHRDSDDETFVEPITAIPRDDSGITPGEIEEKEDSKESLTKEDSGLSCEVPSVTVSEIPSIESSKDLIGESDDEDNFYDAVSTPSPFSKSSFELGEVRTVDKNEGSSVDAVEENDESIELRSGSIEKDKNGDGGRDSVIVENVTEGESSTDVSNEFEKQNVETNIEVESELESTANGEQVNFVESSVDGQDVEVIQSPESETKTDEAVDDAEKRMPEEESEKEGVEIKDESEDSADAIETEILETVDAKESVALESFNSEWDSERETELNKNARDLKDSSQRKDDNQYQDEELHITESSVRAVEEGDTGIGNRDSEPVYENIDISKTVDMSKENGEEKRPQKNEESATEETQVIKTEDNAATGMSSPDKEDKDVELSQPGREKDKQEKNEESAGDDKEEAQIINTEDQTTASISSPPKDEKDVTVLSQAGRPKMMVHTVSIGESEASDAAALDDDYDLDDIEDILDLNTKETEDGAKVEEAVKPIEAEAVEEESDKVSSSPQESPKVDAPESSATHEKQSVTPNKDSKSKASKKKEASTEKKAEKKTDKKAEKKSKDKDGKEAGSKATDSKVKGKSVVGGDKRLSKADSETSLEPEDLERALEKRIKESGGSKEHKKSKADKKAEKKSKKEAKEAGAMPIDSKGKAEAVGGSEETLSKADSETSLEPEDLEGALEKHIKESDGSKDHKKSKKLNFLKKVFK